jgi:peroxiredoxin
MVVNYCLLTCTLLLAQPPERNNWQFAPRLSRGQELVYRGSYSEEAVGNAVQFSRTYRLENRVMILDASARGFDVAFYTLLRQRPARLEHKLDTPPSSVRLEVARLGPQGRLSADPAALLTVPLDGPATSECGMFVESPGGRITLKQTWEVTEENRPVRVWKFLGTEVVNSTSCLKLEGLQQSEDWDQPRADRTAWRRRDTVWVSPSLGVAYKVERTVERREPARKEPTQRSVVEYELQTNLVYPGQLFENCRREILQGKKFAEEIAPYLPNPARYGTRPFETLLVKIDHYLETSPRTAYRDAVLQVKRRVEAGKRGELPPEAPGETVRASGVAVGQRAPDFLTTNLLNGKSVRLHNWIGRSIALVFYTPNSLKAEEVLRFAQKLQDAHATEITVLPLALSDDTERIQEQQKEFAITLPILSGKGLRQSYGVDATPKFVVIDRTGIVRGAYLGWGPETPTSVTDEVERWLKKADQPKQK